MQLSKTNPKYLRTSRLWKKRNREYCLSYTREWKKNNGGYGVWARKYPDRAKECHRKYYEKNKEKCADISRKYNKKNRLNIQKYAIAYRKKNRSRLTMLQRLREKRIKRATPPWLDTDLLLPFYKKAERMSKTRKEKYSVDHIFPITNKRLSGLNVPWNLRVITLRANIRKSNKVDYGII